VLEQAGQLEEVENTCVYVKRWWRCWLEAPGQGGLDVWERRRSMRRRRRGRRGRKHVEMRCAVAEKENERSMN
jgi:hypothetical protein